MGIGINVNSNQDVSYLFQGLSGGGSSNLNYLSDYAAIKNGSYGRLMKAYYGSASTSVSTSSGSGSGTGYYLDRILEEKKNPKVSKDVQEANASLTSGISTLKNTVSALQNENTYKVTQDGVSAGDKVFSAVKDYVSQYNDVVTAAKNSTLTGKTSHVAAMMKSSQANAEKLGEIGITVNDDGTLQLNESKLKATDISKVQELFSKDDIMGYGSTVMSRLGFAGVAAGPVSGTEKTEEQEEETTYAGASSLKTDIKNLTSDSLFVKKQDENGSAKYDVDKILAAVKSFAGNYNSMLSSVSSGFNSGAMSNLARVMEKTEQNKAQLEKFGISVDTKGRLKVDEDTLRKADMSELQKFFKEYGSSIATNVSLVDYYMTTQANAANNYNSDGAYDAKGGFRFSSGI